MKIPELSSGFCGCSLKLSTQIIAYFQLLVEIIGLIVIILSFGLGAFVISGRPTPSSSIRGFTDDTRFTDETPEDKEFDSFVNSIVTGAGVVIGVVLVFVALLVIIQLSATILLLVGAHKEKPGYLPFWLTLSILQTIGSIGTMSEAGVFYFVVNIYFIWVVYSFYNQLKGAEANLLTGDGINYHKQRNAPPPYP